MSNSPPPRGSVIRYAYLWADRHAAGEEEGSKDRPVLVLSVSGGNNEGPTRLLVLPITHTPQTDHNAAVSVPAELKHRLGLDDAPSWIVTTEANAFTWPGPDIRPVPGRRRTVLYGRVPDRLLAQAARSFLANRARQRARLVGRTE